MPANTLDSYFMQDTRNNFDAMRPVPVCSDANQLVGQCHRKIHISTNCYYGYQLPQNTSDKNEIEDCEMMEAPAIVATSSTPPPMQGYNARKRGAELLDYAQCKRLKEEVQRERRNIEPETTEKKESLKSPEELVEDLYWNTHGGHFFHLCLFHMQPGGHTIEPQPFSFSLEYTKRNLINLTF